MTLVLLAYPAWADDTDIYGVSTIDVMPNVLIIFDNSGSMGTNDVPADPYVPATVYAGTKTTNGVYKKSSRWSSSYDTLYFADINNSNWQCAAAKTDLLTKGYWTGRLNVSSGVVTCGGRRDPKETLRLGNFDNYDALGLGAFQTRMEVAKEVVAKLIYDNAAKVRFGVMKFNLDTDYEGGFIVSECGASVASLIGSYDPATTVFTDSDQSASFGAIGGMRSDTYTPLAETMAEAGLYFAGKTSWFNGTTTGPGYPLGRYSSTCTASNTGCQDYSGDSPIQYRCQKSYIILMTDGEPTQDSNSKLNNNAYINSAKIPDAGMDGVSNYLDDVAYYLAHNDLRSDLGEPGDFENQTATIYTIGFQQNLTLLEETAINGGGEYYTADNADTLNEALNNIISAINENNEAFSAAAVPVSRANKAYAGNFVYYGLFQPLTGNNWAGNLKKYGITDFGVIQDVNGMDATSGGLVVDNAISYWSTNIDGPKVMAGGAGEILTSRIQSGVSRNIYTYTGTIERDLTAADNKFSTANALLTTATYPGLTASVIGAVRHEADNSWPFASFLHSQPLVVHYDDDGDGNDDHSIVYAGANDGMLHCIDDIDGNERWGFIPRDLLDDLAPLESPSTLLYYVDGTPVYYGYGNQKMIIFGERRGGYHYSALNITDYTTPYLQYEVAPNILGVGSESLGQSWGKPQGGKMISGGGLTDAFLMVGGYDNNQDSLTPAVTDNKGRAVFAIDAQTGALISDFNFNADNFASMTHSIIAASGFENPKSRTTTRVYAGDMNGNVFGFRDDIFHRDLAVDGDEDGIWGQKVKLFSTPGKKIFYAPNIVNEYFPVSFTYPAPEKDPVLDVTKDEDRVGDYVFYGTGDRAHPTRIDIVNGFYALKNNWQWSSETPTIVQAYVDPTDSGKIKAKDDNRVLVAQQRDADGLLRDGDGEVIPVDSSDLFILDVTDDLYQNTEGDADTRKLYTNYVTDAINHPSNRGWFIELLKADGSAEGEKVVSSPIIFGGVIYFTTYIPEPAAAVVGTDPCENPGANGAGYLYAIGYEFGEAIMDLYEDPANPGVIDKKDRKKKLLPPGIPPEPVLVIHEGKPSILTGFEREDPEFTQSMKRFYWREMNR